jgi:putative glutamine amidotransferase
MRPLIGLTLGYDDRLPGRHTLRQDYVRAVEAAGGLPLPLAPVAWPDPGLALLDRLDGLLLTGGADVDPALYGEEAHPRLRLVVRERDEFELALVREALARDLPVLGICRGLQVLNVAAGGTLIQDIPAQVGAAVDHDPDVERWADAHEVEVQPGSRLREVLGQDMVPVNSFHHQGVKRVGEGLVVAATSPRDGIIEAVEMPSRRFVLAVQWHPEALWNRSRRFQPLFEAHVRASS